MSRATRNTDRQRATKAIRVGIGGLCFVFETGLELPTIIGVFVDSGARSWSDLRGVHFSVSSVLPFNTKLGLSSDDNSGSGCAFVVLAIVSEENLVKEDISLA